MEIKYPKEQIHNPLECLRKAGYSPFTDPKTHEDSFILRLTAGFYPRFHLYLNDHGSELEFSLHLDQKKPSYKGTSAHGGEYDGPTVEKEMERIRGWIEHVEGIVKKNPKSEIRNQTQTEETNKKPPKKRFGGIFG